MRNPEFTVDCKQQTLLTPGSEAKDIQGWLESDLQRISTIVRNKEITLMQICRVG